MRGDDRSAQDVPIDQAIDPAIRSGWSFEPAPAGRMYRQAGRNRFSGGGR